MPISHVAFVAVQVSDLDRAIAFYTDKLGFAKTTDNTMGPMRWVEVTPAGQNTRVTLIGPGNPAYDAARVGVRPAATFEVTDWDATIATLRAKGVPFHTEPQHNPWGWWAEIRDPDGNGLGLHAEA
ncbi:MAG: VOC family protein [Myxococcota bacterium]